MTNSPRSEVFIFDIAVDPLSQREGWWSTARRGVVRAERRGRDRLGVVAADSDDAHALDFYRSLGATGSAVTIFSFDSPQYPGEPLR